MEWTTLNEFMLLQVFAIETHAILKLKNTIGFFNFYNWLL